MNKKKNPHAQPKVWGSHAWSLLHCIVMTYPLRPTPQKQKEMKEFIYSFGKVLPCKLCRKNFHHYIQKNPVVVDTRAKLRDWVIDLHNSVNQRLGKPVLTHSQALKEIASVCKLQSP